jgi:glycosyltransferase involved in cell wall biosynthesis
MPDGPLRDRIHAQPLVSVITPVYNGAKHLPECIESVLAQTYQNWEYVIVDNCSTDRSLEIAQRYARHDARICVHSNHQFVSVHQNHHIAFRQMAPESEYCKVVHADDWLFPDCIKQMVEVGEAHPSVGIVAAYRLLGDWVDLGGLPYPSAAVPGREVCRLVLLWLANVFGSPTSLLMRSECIRRLEGILYDGERFPRHADVAACYELLQEWDFGFVHQVLTYSRYPRRWSEAGNEMLPTRTSFSLAVKSHLPEGVGMLMKYGPIYLSRAEYEQCLQHWVKRYRRFLWRSMLQRRDKPFWDYHKRMLSSLGWPLSPVRLFLVVAVDAALSPVKAVRKRIGVGSRPASS